MVSGSWPLPGGCRPPESESESEALRGGGRHSEPPSQVFQGMGGGRWGGCFPPGVQKGCGALEAPRLLPGTPQREQTRPVARSTGVGLGAEAGRPEGAGSAAGTAAFSARTLAPHPTFDWHLRVSQPPFPSPPPGYGNRCGPRPCRRRAVARLAPGRVGAAGSLPLGAASGRTFPFCSAGVRRVLSPTRMSGPCLVQLASWGLRWQERKTMLQDGPQDGRRLGNPGVPSPGQVLVPRDDSPRHAR